MIGLKGETPAIWLVLLMLIMVFAFVAIFAWQQQQQLAPARVLPVEYKGEWYKVYAPKYVSGTDLTITETSITDGGTVTLAMSYNINGTNGATYYMAFGVKVRGKNGFKSVDIDGSLASSMTSKIAIRKAYIVPDEEGKNLDVSDAIYVARITPEQDEFEFRLPTLPEGNYVVVVEAKGISTTTIAHSAQLLSIKFDGVSEGDVTEFTVNINNG